MANQQKQKQKIKDLFVKLSYIFLFQFFQMNLGLNKLAEKLINVVYLSLSPPPQLFKIVIKKLFV